MNWMPIDTATYDEPFMVGLWVTSNTGQRWWETYIVVCDGDTGELKSWPDDSPLGWELQDFEAWQPLPEPPQDYDPEQLERADALHRHYRPHEFGDRT